MFEALDVCDFEIIYFSRKFVTLKGEKSDFLGLLRLSWNVFEV